jgi:hypothetical protein
MPRNKIKGVDVALLVEGGADINDKTETIGRHCMWRRLKGIFGSSGILSILGPIRTPCWLTVLRFISLLRMDIEKGVNIHATNAKNRTALALAATPG